MTFRLEQRRKSWVSREPIVRFNGVMEQSAFVLRGGITPSFILNCSCEKTEIGGCVISLVAPIQRLVSSRNRRLPSLMPIFAALSSIRLLFLFIWCDFCTRVFTQKYLLSTTTLLSKSSISFYFKLAISFTMSSPEMKTVLKQSAFEKVYLFLTLLQKSGLPSSAGLYD